MIEIREVKKRKEIKQFVDFPLKLYKGNPYYVPALYEDEIEVLKKNSTYCDQVETIYFNAYKDGQMCGRISGIIQKASNAKWNQKRVRFTRFDSIDDLEVSNMLFSAVEKWAKDKGMQEIVGPLGFSDLEREGLLIEGFDQLSTFEECYNYDYYPKLVEAYGFVKDVDWTERMLKAPKVKDERYAKVGALIMKKHNLHFIEYKNVNQLIKKYGKKIFETIDESYKDLYGTVPITDKMIKTTLKGFKMMIKPKYIAAIANENEEIVCFGIGIPSISKSVNATGGKLFPFGFIKILKEKNNPTVIDLALVGVVDKYKKTGVSAAIFGKLLDMIYDPSIDHFETNLNLEDNHNITNTWKAFDNVIHKRRRAYKKKIE